MLATSCEDKQVRLFYLATTNETPLKIFSGIFVNFVLYFIFKSYVVVFINN